MTGVQARFSQPRANATGLSRYRALILKEVIGQMHADFGR